MFNLSRPKRIHTFSFLKHLLLILLFTGVSHSQVPWNCVVTGELTTIEKNAVVDMQRYLGQVTGNLPKVVSDEQWQKKPVPALIVGRPEKNSAIQTEWIEKEDLGQQGYVLMQKDIKAKSVIVVAGKTPQGVVNGVYGLLRELGYGFVLGSETIPEKLPDTLRQTEIIKVPKLKIRGTVSWPSFFDGPTAWNPLDYRTYVDSLIRSGANLFGLRAYDNEPFAAFKQDGKFHSGARLFSTANPVWGTRPSKIEDFAFGTKLAFRQDYFGADTTEMKGTSEVVIQREQDILRDAFAYAKARGVKGCFGFELYRNPMNETEAKLFISRIKYVIEQYPDTDYLWLWQPEVWGATGFKSAADMSSSAYRSLTNYGRDRRELFSRVVNEVKGVPPFFEDNEAGRKNRANEGARLEQYARMALRVLAQYENPPRLVISGWGGDNRILSADYYEGLDKLLPKDVIFSSLDLIGPHRRVDHVYNKLPSDRERWPIPWLENDGDQWHPQPYVDIYQDLMKVLVDGGSQGVLGINWRTRGIEENFQFLVDTAWQPGLRAEDFYDDYARRRYDPQIAEQMSKIHLALDRQPYRWVGGSGQVECAPFSWGDLGDEKHLSKLTQLQSQCRDLLPKASAGKEQLSWLIARIDWVIAYRTMTDRALEAHELMKAGNYQQALEILDGDEFPDALHKYVKRITTRGEYGVLATINCKAVEDWRQKRNECLEKLGISRPEPHSDWKPEPDIILPQLVGSTVEGEDLSLEPIVLSGADAWMHYRTIGKKPWKTVKLQPLARWLQKGVVPAGNVNAPGLEFAFSFSGNPAKPFAFGPRGVTVLPIAAPSVRKGKEVPAQKTDLDVRVAQGNTTPIMLKWNEIAGAEYYRIVRDGEQICVTAVSEFPDVSSQLKGWYTVEAVSEGRVLATSEKINYEMPNIKITEKPAFEIMPNNAGNLIVLAAVEQSACAKYRIYRSGKPLEQEKVDKDMIFHHLEKDRKQDNDKMVLIAELETRPGEDIRYMDRVPEGNWTYRVALVNVAAIEGEQTSEASVNFRKKKVVPAKSWSFTQADALARQIGSVEYTEQGLLVKDGYIDIPQAPFMNFGESLTVEFDFIMQEKTMMPVILCNGAYNSDGWYVQILGHAIQVRIPGVNLMGPVAETGKWYHIVFVYDGKEGSLQVNGQWVDRKPFDKEPKSTQRDLRIGNYITVQPEFQFKGLVKDLRIFNGVAVDLPK